MNLKFDYLFLVYNVALLICINSITFFLRDVESPQLFRIHDNLGTDLSTFYQGCNRGGSDLGYWNFCLENSRKI